MLSVAFSSSIFSSTVYGGIPRYFTELGVELDKLAGVSVNYIAPIYTNKYLACAPSNLVFGHHLSRLPGSASIYPLINSLIEPHLINIIRPSILHYTYYNPIYKRSYGSKVVITVFDMIHELYPQFFAHADTTRIHKLQAIRSADHIIAISQSTKNDLLEYFNLPDEMVSVVYLASSLKPLLIKQQQPKACKPYILYVGDRGGYKNFLSLLRAYAASTFLADSFDLICVGGHPLGHNELTYINTYLPRKDSVKRISCDDARLASYLSDATLLCYPSIYEGFGLPLLEAANNHCPVVCSYIPVFVEIMGESAYYFDPRSIDSIRSALETVILSPSLRENLVMQANKAAQKYSWKRCSIETHGVYTQLV